MCIDSDGVYALFLHVFSIVSIGKSKVSMEMGAVCKKFMFQTIKSLQKLLKPFL